MAGNTIIHAAKLDEETERKTVEDAAKRRAETELRMEARRRAELIKPLEYEVRREAADVGPVPTESENLTRSQASSKSCAMFIDGESAIVATNLIADRFPDEISQEAPMEYDCSLHVLHPQSAPNVLPGI